MGPGMLAKGLRHRRYRTSTIAVMTDSARIIITRAETLSGKYPGKQLPVKAIVPIFLREFSY